MECKCMFFFNGVTGDLKMIPKKVAGIVLAGHFKLNIRLCPTTDYVSFRETTIYGKVALVQLKVTLAQLYITQQSGVISEKSY